MRVVVFGSGRMATLRARLLGEHPAIDEVVLSGRNPIRLAELGHELAMASIPLDRAFEIGAAGIVISTATTDHCELLRRAIANGITTFCEKPLTMDVSETADIAALADHHQVMVQVGYHRHFDPGMRALREAVRSGRAGTLYAIRMLSHDHTLPSPEFVASSGGIFKDLHVHDFDLLRWLTGTEVKSVFATGSIRLHERFAASGDVDTAVTLVTMADGLVASVHGARHDPAGYDVRVEIFGSQASLAAGVTERTPLSVPGEHPPWSPHDPYVSFLERFHEAFAEETSAFVELLQGARANPCSPSADLAAMCAAVASEQSRREGRPVEVAAPGQAGTG